MQRLVRAAHIEGNNFAVGGNTVIVQNLTVDPGVRADIQAAIQIAAGGTSQNAGTLESCNMLDVIGSLSNTGTLECLLTIEDGAAVYNSGTLETYPVSPPSGTEGSLCNTGTLEVEDGVSLYNNGT